MVTGVGGYDFFLNWEKSHPTSNWEWDQFSSLGSHWWHCVVSPGMKYYIKVLSAMVVCCIQLLSSQTNFSIWANSVDPDQSAPRGVV